MARLTVERGKKYVNSLFELVIVAAHRTKQLLNGAPAVVKRANNKPHVLALREIEEGKIDIQNIREKIVMGLQKHGSIDQSEELLNESDLTDEKFLASGSSEFAEDMKRLDSEYAAESEGVAVNEEEGGIYSEDSAADMIGTEAVRYEDVNEEDL